MNKNRRSIPFPDGHFYSPTIDPQELEARRGRIWPAGLPATPGIEYRDAAQRAWLRSVRHFAADHDYPQLESQTRYASEFFERNTQFEGLDARAYFCMLRHLEPQRVIEVGCGYSSLLAADVNQRFLNGQVLISCVEPYPKEFLKKKVPGIFEVIEAKVQDLAPSFFAELEEGDVLFIDSSHVSKTGSDVNFLTLQILPILQRGVIVHIHDIFLPRDYPEDWVLGEHRSWNEQYLLQALLMHSTAFEVVFGCAYAAGVFPELVEEVFGAVYGGGSFWIRKTL